MDTFSDSDEEVGRSTNGRNCILENNEKECLRYSLPHLEYHRVTYDLTGQSSVCTQLE